MSDSISPSGNTIDHPYIAVLGTGGTISCTHADNGDLVPTLTTAELVEQAHLPADNASHVAIEPRDIMQLDSSNITLEDIDTLLRAIDAEVKAGASGIVLLHGTDTMEETAMAVHRFFNGAIPIAITGAQRPSDDTNPDGPNNIRAAVEFLTTGTKDVAIVFGGSITPAYGATKRHTTEDDAFACTFTGSAPERLSTLSPLAGLHVPVITMFGGADASIVPTHSPHPLDGLVVAALGSGNVPQRVSAALQELECPVVISTRVPEGSVHFVYGGAGGGAALERAGFHSAGSLRPSQARIKLLCELATNQGWQ